MVIAIAAYACGAWGLAGSFLWTFAGTRRRMLLVQLSTGPGYLLHWALLGHGTAAFMTALSMLLALAATLLDGEKGSGRVRAARTVYLLAAAAVVLLTARTWEGIPSLFAGLGTLLACIGRWQTDGARFRAFLLASSVPWFLHNLAAGSPPALASDLFCLGRGVHIAWQSRARRRRPPAAVMPMHGAVSAAGG